MSFSNVYDAIIDRVWATVPSKTRLHNPYELTDNPEFITKDSWGLKILESDIVETDWCNISNGRNFSVILLSQFATVGSKDDAFDSVSKSIIEDQESLINAIAKTDRLTIPEQIDQIEFTNISGLEFMIADQKKYLFCSFTFKITMSNLIV